MTLLTLESRALIKLSWLIIWASQALISPETINQDRVNSKGLQEDKLRECQTNYKPTEAEAVIQ